MQVSEYRFIARLFLFAFLACCGIAAAADAEQKAEVVFSLDAESEQNLKGTLHGGFYTVVEGNGGHCILVENKDAGKSVYISIHLDAEKVAGKTLDLSAMIKGEKISEKAKSYNGVKLQFQIEDSAGAKTYPQAKIGTGDFEWEKFSVLTRIPAGAKKVSVLIGLENVTGSAWFDDIQVKTIE